MVRELLLDWASERGHGSWQEFRDAHDWLFEGADRRPQPGTTAHAFSILGHLEVDWQEGRWAAAPPVLTLLPRAGEHAVLTGARTRALSNALEAATADKEDFFCERYPQEWGPDAQFVAGRDETALEGLATGLGIAYEPCISDRLAQVLPPLDSFISLARSTPAARGYGVRRFHVKTLLFAPTDDDSTPGLYQYGVNRRRVYRWHDESGSHYALDFATGIYAELRRSGCNELRYVRDNINGTLTVPFRAQLPALHARAAALCSGLMPSLTRGRWHYPNVPRPTARRIAKSLGQQLYV
jgi:hypothetical protein